MERIHQAFLTSGRMATVQRPQDIAGIQFTSLPATYPRFGIRPELAQATHDALHELCTRTLEEGGSTPTHFLTVMQELQGMGRVRKRSVSLIHFLGLASHYGIRFRSLKDLSDAICGLHLMIAPGIAHVDKGIQRNRYLEYCGDLLALLGEGVENSPVSDLIENGVSSRMILCAAQILSVQSCVISGKRLLWLGVLSAHRSLDPIKVGRLTSTHPERIDDFIELMLRDLLTDKIIDALAQEPDLVCALSLDALDTLVSVWDPADGTILEIAQAFSEAMTEANEQMRIKAEIVDYEPPAQEARVEAEIHPQVVLSFDHTRLDVENAVGKRTDYAVQAIQILLVHGVIQPDKPVSSMINGSEILRDELDKLCRPHLIRAGISEEVFEKAFTFLTTIRVLVTRSTGGGRKRADKRRVRFDCAVRGNARGTDIAQRVLDLNREVRG